MCVALVVKVIFLHVIKETTRLACEIVVVVSGQKFLYPTDDFMVVTFEIFLLVVDVSVGQQRKNLFFLLFFSLISFCLSPT
jgi:hypothetical protein